MNVILSKIKTYIGFATKSGKIKIGADNILKAKNSKIILVSDALAANTLSKLESFAAKLGVEVAKLQDAEFAEVAGKEGIKALAVTNPDLASAIKNNLAEISRGGKLD